VLDVRLGGLPGSDVALAQEIAPSAVNGPPIVELSGELQRIRFGQ